MKFIFILKSKHNFLLSRNFLISALLLGALCVPAQLSSQVPANLLLGAMRKIVQRPGFDVSPTKLKAKTGAARKVAWGAWGAWVGVGLGCVPFLVREKNGEALIAAVGTQDSAKVAEALDCWNINIDRGWSRCGDNYSFTGRTALGWAIFYGNTEIVKQLLDARADALRTDSCDNKATGYEICSKSGAKMAEILPAPEVIAQEKNLNHKNLDRLIPTEFTPEVQPETEKEVPTEKPTPPIYSVPSMSIKPVVSHNFSQISADTQKLVEELVAAIKNRDAVRVQELLQAGVSVNQKDRLGNTPLYYAIAYGFVEIARLLIDAGARL